MAATLKSAHSRFENLPAFLHLHGMRFVVGRFALVLCAMAGAGCDAQVVAPPPAKAQTVAGTPQPRLPTIKLLLGSKEMTAEIARTPRQIQTGMMWRTEMGGNEGMIFVFNAPHRASFWMKDTLVPLSCAYIAPDGTILEIHDMKPLDETPIRAGTDRVQFVLETPQGWFERNQIKAGTLIATELGSLKETFFQQR